MIKHIHSDSNWSMELLKNNFEVIYLDLSFQRMACWSDRAKKSYITSILEGAHPGYLILASVNANAYRNEYFKDLQVKGYQYLSIDGNNRSNCIVQFMNDEFLVSVNGKSLKYSELDVNDRAQFNNLRLGIVLYENIDKEGCANIFLSHNESQPLSAQEKRNARIGEISTYIRELEPKVRKNIKTFDEDNKRRGNDEFIVDILISEINPSSPVGKKDRDEFWFDNLSEIKFNKSSLRETLDLLGNFINLKNFGKQSLEGLAKDFIIIRGLMKKNNGVVIDKDKFISLLASKRTALFNSKQAYTIVGKKGKEEALQYSTIVSQPTFHAPLSKRVQLLENILIELQAEGCISYKSKRSVNTSDPILRKELFDKQNGICPASGKQIEDPLNGQLWEVDHIDPLAKGGPDTLENMQLIDMMVNRKKGAKLLVKKVS
jgi:hypothetical protein